jgi:arylsulfatase A-like enzyme
MNVYQNPKEVALFSSWNKIQYATEGLYLQRATQSIGLNPVKNFVGGSHADEKILAAAKQDLPEWEDARKDRYTWALATRYIEAEQPRFAYISLLDTDEWAHENNRKNYFLALSGIDTLISRFISRLSSSPRLNAYLENTSIVITTDHGRGGSSWNFRGHGSGPFVNGSENVFAIVIPSKTLREHYKLSRLTRKDGRYSQLDIRPTVENLLLLPKGRNLVGSSLIRMQNR